MPLMNRTTAMAQVSRTACFSDAVPATGRRSAERSEWRRCIYVGQDGEER